MASNSNKPRLHQYRVGSLIKSETNAILEIEKIEKLKSAPMTFAVTFRNIANLQELKEWEKTWCGAHMLNDMLDKGIMQVLSY